VVEAAGLNKLVFSGPTQQMDKSDTVAISPSLTKAKNDKTLPTFKVIQYKLNHDNPKSFGDGWVQFILQDRTGILWIGTETGGLKRLDPNTGRITPGNYNPHVPAGNSVQRVWVGCLDRAGKLWLGDWGVGLFQFDPLTEKAIHYKNDLKNFRSLYHPLWISKIYEDQSGVLWVGTDVLNRLNRQSGEFTHFVFSPHLKNTRHLYNNDAISQLYEDRSRMHWLGTVRNGLIKLNLHSKKFVHYQHQPENPNSLSCNDIRLLFEDRAGMIWISFYNDGLSRYDPRTGKFTHFRHDPNDPASLGHNSVRAIYEDRSGKFWFGTVAGLDLFEPRSEKIIRIKHDPRANVFNKSTLTTIAEDDAVPHRVAWRLRRHLRQGGIWFGTAGGGLYKLVPGDVDRLASVTDSQATSARASSRPQFSNNAVRLIQYQHDPEDSTSIGDNVIWDIHEDRFGNFWVATDKGINLMDRQIGRFINANRWPEAPSSNGRIIYEDKSGIIWAPSHFGLGRIDVKTKGPKRYKLVSDTLNVSTFYPRSPFHEDRFGMIWTGGQYGLLKLDPAAQKFIAYYSEKDGLAANFLQEIVGDNAGNLWLLTGKGLSIFNENAPPGKQFRHLDGKDGVVNSPTAVKGLLKAKDGSIYWGGANGLYRFFPENLKNNPRVPPVVLTEFRVLNQAVKLDSAISAKKQITLGHEQNSFSFSFVALDFARPLSNQYAYRLEGVDKDWIEAGNRRYANYTHIPPGEYIFRVKGSNNDGVWNEVGASVKIIITPPFWQTWWFRLLALLAIAGALEALYKYRVKKKLEIEATRNRIARDLHDDIGSSLSNIALMSELMQGKRTLEEKESRQLRQIGATSRQIVEAMEDIVWAINPDYDKLDNLLLRLKDVTAELLRQQGITYTFHFPEQELLQSLPMNFRRNLLLIYKELLHNVIKHAQATHVDIALAKTDGCLVLKLADNGIGFEMKAAKNGNGLKSMQTRAAELKGKLEIESQPNEGTRVTLAVKL